MKPDPIYRWREMLEDVRIWRETLNRKTVLVLIFVMLPFVLLALWPEIASHLPTRCGICVP